MFSFQNKLAAFLIFIIVGTISGTVGVVIYYSSSVITQPIATLIGVVLVPTIALFGFITQKRLERSYEISTEARGAAREFIDASSGYSTSLFHNDLDNHVYKFSVYQSNWFQLHTVMPEVFKPEVSRILHRHYNALTKVSQARRAEITEGKVFDNKLLSELIESEDEMVSILSQICTGMYQSKSMVKSIRRAQIVKSIHSRGNVLTQMGFIYTHSEALEQEKLRSQSTHTLKILEDNNVREWESLP